MHYALHTELVLPTLFTPSGVTDTSCKLLQARIQTDTDYIRSLRGRNLKVYMFGELLPEFVDHPIIRPSINAVAETYRLAQAEPDLASACSSISGVRCSRFLHVTETVKDVVKQGLMQRKLGQLTGTCFQRCVGMDAINSTFSVTYEIDAAFGARTIAACYHHTQRVGSETQSARARRGERIYP